MRRVPAFGAACLLLAGCSREAPPPSESDGQRVPAAPAPSPSSAAPAITPAPQGPPALVPEADKGETGARNVLLEWARDLERGDYDGAYALWLDGARSGMTEAEHRAFWRGFRTITVAAPTGTMQGAAGSLYYEAPVSVSGERSDGTPYRLDGTVVLRRVNDVPGATPNQLRWHLEKVDLAPAG